MNWSAYSRFVGDVFGAPLAMEGLAAFFLESTFLGLWIFGWKVLPRRVHLATIWLVAVGAMLSAAFIMAANSWMQHPVGYTTNPETGRPQLSSIGDLFTNPVFIWGYIHVILASLVTGAVRDARGVRVAARRTRARRAVHDARPNSSLVVLLPASIAGARGRQPPRGDRGDVPADEDLGRRGAVGDLSAVLVLAVPDRRRQERRDPDPDASRFPTCCRCSPPAPGTARSSGSTSCRRHDGPAVRRRQLRAGCAHPVLVDAGDGLPRQPDHRCSPSGASGCCTARNCTTSRVFLVRRDLGGAGARS